MASVKKGAKTLKSSIQLKKEPEIILQKCLRRDLQSNQDLELDPDLDQKWDLVLYRDLQSDRKWDPGQHRGPQQLNQDKVQQSSLYLFRKN